MTQALGQPSPSLVGPSDRSPHPFAGRSSLRTEIEIAGECFEALASGALWRPSNRMLIVSDLHLEKGSAYARRGQMLPPYDTAATLAALSVLVFGFDPATVIALGDSFHDNDGAKRLGPYDRGALTALQRGRNWIWIAGNHDDDLPPEIGGERVDTLSLGSLVFRHEPAMGAAGDGEVAGHFHPAARVVGRSGSVRRRCFAGDGRRLIMPAFGAFAGGLNVLEPVVVSLFAEPLVAFVLGSESVYRVPRSRLRGD